MASDSDELRGRVALVSGSSSGIGEATVHRLAAAGADVVVNSAHSVEAGRAVAESVDGRYIQADIADEDACRRLVDATIDEYGRLDILVNNAGWTKVIPHHDLDAVTDEVFRRILDVNVLGTWFLTRAAMPHLKASGDGVVVNVSSVAGVRTRGSSIPYAVSKAAVNHLTRLLAAVVGPEVRVNAVAPGLVDTPWTEDWDVVRGAVHSTAPLRRSAQPDDVAEVVLGLVRSRYVTGEVVLCDGGLSQV